MNLQVSIRRILRESDTPIQIRRRLSTINHLIDVAIDGTYVCEYADSDSFLSNVVTEMGWLVRNEEYRLNDLDWMDIYEYLRTYREDEIRQYFNDNWEGCVDDLNESKDKKLLLPKKNYLNIIESLIEPFKDEVGVCDITVLYEEYDDMYSIYIILGSNEMDTMFSRNNTWGRENYAKELRYKVKNDIKSYLTIPNIYVGSYNSYKCVDDLNESITGITPTDTVQQLINKPVKLIGDVNTNTIIQNVNVNKDGSVNITFKNGLKLNSSIPLLRKFNLGVSIPLEFKVKKKTVVAESKTNNKKSFKSLENTVQNFINMNLDDYNVPTNLYDVAVDVKNDPYGRLECVVSFLFKKPFSVNDSDKLHHILRLIKKEITDYFGDTFYHIRSGVSTVEMYNHTKSRDKK